VAHIPFVLQQQLALQILKCLCRVISGLGLKKDPILTMKLNQRFGLSLMASPLNS